MNSDFQNFIFNIKINILSLSSRKWAAVQRVLRPQERLSQYLALVAAYPESADQVVWREELMALGSSLSRTVKLTSVGFSFSFAASLLYRTELGIPRNRLLYLEWVENKTGEPPGLDHYANFDFYQVIYDLIVNPESIFSVK